ncbi:MAG: choice-of-anchor D domain-containing protein, partial [Solirubrobacteraceae bacterium]
FTVANDGDVPAADLASALSGGNAGDFAIAGGTCPAGGQLAGGASCTVVAEFDPQAAGSKQTTLEVSGTPGGSASTTLSGRGVAAAALGFDSLVVDFGNVAFNSSSTRTLTLRNTGGSSTSAISLAITGTNASRFAIEPTGDTCSGQTLASGATCTFTIRFTPLNMGAKTAFVTASAAQGGAGSARLDGNGT